MVLTNLDMDVLRTLAVAMERGSFAQAAQRLGRSQSAVSLQMRKLEGQIGQTLFRKAGRGLALTEAGDVVLGYAKRILELNDEAVTAVKGLAVAGTVRLGLHQDFAEAWLPSALAGFARAHPAVQVSAEVERKHMLLERMGQGRLDLALVFGDEPAPGPGITATRITELPMGWIAGDAYRPPADAGAEPLPLVLFEAPCVFRDAALAALERARVPWRLALTSPSLAGLWAAAGAGLGVTVRTRLSLPRGLTLINGLPKLPKVPLTLHCVSAPSPAVARLRDILLEVLANGLPDQATT
ncbi:MAG: LysR family transcriptional regulator [Alphaproteobacteria bacterium]|nr:LysR family transcriptional regulator [Alphaproteobacteria bacterium]